MKYFCFIVNILLLSCSDGKLEYSLQFERKCCYKFAKVLDHFSAQSNDSLGLVAAKFLIDNMLDHFVIEDDKINELRTIIQNDTSKTYLYKKCYDIILANMLNYDGRKIPLTERITSEYLIHYVERAIKLYKDCPWLHEQNFCIFLEYVLPFVFENESIDYWRDSLYPSKQSLKHIKCINDLKYTTMNAYHLLALSETQDISRSEMLEHILGEDIEQHCFFLAYRRLIQNRALGIPSAIDFIPYYANRNGYHCWNSIVLSDKKNFLLEIGDRKAAKIYRKTYSHNRHLTITEGEFVPKLFLSPFNKDVTDSYLYTCDLNIPIDKHFKFECNNYYLGVFCNLAWNAVTYGEKHGKNIHFRKMGKDIIYLPFCYKNKSLKPFNYPFILKQNEQVQYLIPDTTCMQNIVLMRKYPINLQLDYYVQSLAGLCVEASNDDKFQNVDTILFFSYNNRPYYSEYTCTEKVFRYWRISKKSNIPTEIAEVTFIGTNHTELKGTTSIKYESIFDNDPLTSISLLNEDIVIDFGEKKQVIQINCLPRSDGNGIYPGEKYELFYHDLEGWKSLGQRIATDYYLEYDRVPQGAIFWLHNWTKGVEERPFTVSDNGDIRFW